MDDPRSRADWCVSPVIMDVPAQTITSNTIKTISDFPALVKRDLTFIIVYQYVLYKKIYPNIDRFFLLFPFVSWRISAPTGFRLAHLYVPIGERDLSPNDPPASPNNNAVGVVVGGV
jgi:hypothetical protein